MSHFVSMHFCKNPMMCEKYNLLIKLLQHLLNLLEINVQDNHYSIYQTNSNS